MKITEDVGESYADVKYDAYSDIFREFLISGTVPLDEAYYFYTYPKGALKFFEKIRKFGSLSIEDEMAATGKQIGSVYNLNRDLRNLGLVNVRNKVFTVTESAADLEEDRLLLFLQAQLKRNRAISLTLAEINQDGTIAVDRIATLLKEMFPSVRAKEKTWVFYSRTTATWIHEAKLAFYDRKGQELRQVDDEALFENVVARGSMAETGFRLPMCFRNAVMDCLEVLAEKGKGIAGMDQLMLWLGRTHQSVSKAVSDNLKLGFLAYDRDESKYRLSEVGSGFVRAGDGERRRIFVERCQKIEVFSSFMTTVKASGSRGVRPREAALGIVTGMELELADATIDKLGMMLANWAEYAGLLVRRRRLCFSIEHVPRQLTLW